MATVDRHYFTVCTRGAARMHIDVPAMLRTVGIDPADLERPGWRGDAETMAALVRRIWHRVGDEAMGFTRHGIPTGAFRFAAELAYLGPTVRDGLSRAVRFYNLVSPDIRTELTENTRQMELGARLSEPELDPDHYFTEFWLIIWHRLACWLGGQTVPLIEASFSYPKPCSYLDEFSRLFPCRHEFNAATCTLVLDKAALAMPIARSAGELAGMLASAPLEIMTIPASDHSYARKIRTLLKDNLGLRAEQAAAALHISPETLRRRLRDERTGFAKELEQARHLLAVRALVRGNRSVEAIAAELGYAEARSFTRAFRAWTGKSPSTYRRENT